MGLAWQQGPLSTRSVGHFLVPDPLPERLLHTEPSRRRMRVRFRGDWIADSDDVVLLHQPGHHPAAYLKAQLFAQRATHNPVRRVGTSDEIAQAVVFALTATFMTGESLGVDARRTSSDHPEAPMIHFDAVTKRCPAGAIAVQSHPEGPDGADRGLRRPSRCRRGRPSPTAETRRTRRRAAR